MPETALLPPHSQYPDNIPVDVLSDVTLIACLNLLISDYTVLRTMSVSMYSGGYDDSVVARLVSTNSKPKFKGSQSLRTKEL